MTRVRLTGILLAGLIATPALAARHVRVVLDLSQSMQRNDPGRLAILSTALLHDLARPNTTTGDSFEVIPFDLDWQWKDPTAAPPVSRHPRIRAERGRRPEFLRALQALPYQARMTYFYPGIAAALADLEQTRTEAYDVRAIVLVTDGVPEKPTRDAELQRIRDELAPRLDEHRIRLYVLAFGSEADRNRDFFAGMVRSPKGASLGEFFVDAQGTQLLSYMLEIFSRSFGFSPDGARGLPGTSTLDLDAGITPEQVAVAVFSARSQPPRLTVKPPQGGSVNRPESVESASTKGGSYSLLWVFSPSQGQYGIDSDALGGSVAVLRPTRLTLEIQAAPPHHQVERVLAGTPVPMRVLVRSPTGAQGDPGPVDLSFRTFGDRILRPGGTDLSYAWETERSAPPAGSGTVTAQGRVYDIVAEFREHPETPSTVYAGYLEVEARRGEAVVGKLAGDQAHRVEVHPPLSISPLPLSAYASSSALQRRQQACTHFTFHQNSGHLPHAGRPLYAVRAVLVPADPSAADRELHEASFTLDGLPLELSGKGSAQTGAWYKGRSLGPAELLGDHEVCVRIGKPTAGDPARPSELTLAATLLEDPYDEFKVVQPFTLKVPVSPPTFLERWRFAFIGGLTALAVLALLWYLRDRPALPPDLGYAVGREGSTIPLAAHTLDPRSAVARLLGLMASSAVLAPGEDRLLGRIRPAAADLFRFDPAHGVEVEPMERQEEIAARRGVATLAVHRLYRLRSDRGSYLFRMEYR